MLRPGACFVLWCVALVGVPVANVGMNVCGPACCACCGMLQRRHKSDAFLKHLGSGAAMRVNRPSTGSVQRRVTAYQMRVYVDIYVSHDIADHG